MLIRQIGIAAMTAFFSLAAMLAPFPFSGSTAQARTGALAFFRKL